MTDDLQKYIDLSIGYAIGRLYLRLMGLKWAWKIPEISKMLVYIRDKHYLFA